jgi:transposase
MAGMRLEEQAAALGPAEMVALLAAPRELVRQKAEREGRTAGLTRQLDWVKRQRFGRKSDRRWREPDAQHLPLAGLTPAPNPPAEAPPPPTQAVKA